MAVRGEVVKDVDYSMVYSAEFRWHGRVRAKRGVVPEPQVPCMGTPAERTGTGTDSMESLMVVR